MGNFVDSTLQDSTPTVLSNSLESPSGAIDLLTLSLESDGGGDFDGDEGGSGATVGGLTLGQGDTVLLSAARSRTSFMPWHLKNDPAVQMFILVI